MRQLLLLITAFCLTLSVDSYAQEDCVSSVNITIGSGVPGTNVGSLPDTDFSLSTGCNTLDYNSAVWYDFTIPAGTSSINFTFTAGTIGPKTVITIIDDCSFPTVGNVAWSTCDANAISGTVEQICNLFPNTTYYIQVASPSGDEGTFTIDLAPNFSSPTNDICELAVDMGVMDCMGGAALDLQANSAACPDPAFGGTCVPSFMGGVWYTFTTPASIEYIATGFGGAGIPGNYAIFSTPSDCSSLTLVHDCTMGSFFSGWQNSTTYYVLVGINLLIHPVQSIMTNTCQGPDPEMNTGNGTGESDWGLSSCVNDDPVEPCFGENVIWWSYTVGCEDANLNLSVEPFTNTSTAGLEIDDSGIAVFETDCSTLMSQYDPNGLGFVCSTVVNNEELNLNNVPAGTQFLIAIASADPDQGYFEVFVNEVPVSGGGLTNDLCVDADPIIVGTNIALDNLCATSDVPFPNCFSQGESTVWYEFDAGPTPVDITFDISPLSISNTAMALYDICGGGILDEICGTTLSLECFQGNVILQVGSSAFNEGNFDLEVSSTPALSPPPISTSPPGICSDTNADIVLNLPPGSMGDILVVVSPMSSPEVTGAQNQNFLNVATATIDDVLVNCSASTQNVIYDVVSVIPGFSCASVVSQIVIPVYPKLLAAPPMVEACLPFDLTLDADIIITGGTSPYTSYIWQWNGSLISTNSVLNNYPLSMDGLITLEVVDVNNCTITTNIDVISHPQVFPIIQSNATEACPGNPSIIDVVLDVNSVVDGLSTSTWNVLDELGLPVTIGTPTTTSYIIDTENVTPGVYTFWVDVQNSFGCPGTSNEIDITIHPSGDGIVSLQYDINCNAQLEVLFYGPGGTDIYNNGPDSNMDGIPDALDANSDGVLDFISITWITPSQNISNGSLNYIPSETGFYEVEIITSNNCQFLIEGVNVLLSPPEPPNIIFPPDMCDGDVVLVVADPMTYINYTWTDEGGNVLGVGGPSLVFNVDSIAALTLLVEDAAGCTHTVTEPINANASPEIMLSGSLTICPGQTTTIDAGGDPSWTYQWLDDMMVEIGSNASIVLDTPGMYTSIVINASNCSDTLAFSIEENAELDIQIAGGNFCQGDSVLLDAGSDFDLYKWTDNMGSVISSEQSIWVSDPGSYTVIVIKELCAGSDTIEIVEIVPPSIDIPSAVNVCSQNNTGETTTLDFDDLSSMSASGFWTSLDLPATILTDLTNVDFGMVAPGNYSFTYTTNVAVSPCQDTIANMIVNVQNCDCPIVDVNELLTLCNSAMAYDIDFEINPISDNGSWTFINGSENVTIPSSNIIDVSGLMTGAYFFQFTLDNLPNPSCPDSDTLEVYIEVEPEIILDGPITVCNTVSPQAPMQVNLNDYLISGSGNWLDPMLTNLDFSDPSDLNFFNVSAGSYVIEFMSNNAVAPCNDITDNITLTVLDCNCPIIDLQPIPDQCNDGSIIDLSLYLGISDPGTWSADPSNPAPITIANGQIELTNRPPGNYQFIYTLDISVVGCLESDLVVIQLIRPPMIDSAMDTTACAAGDGTTVDLTALINANVGVWTLVDLTPITDPTNVDFMGLDIGTVVEFIYTTTGADFPCENVSTSIFITVVDCACDDPVFLDPPVLCNSPDGVVDLEDLLLSSHEGLWSIVQQPAGQDMSLTGTVFNSEDIIGGEYIIQFSLLELINPDCQQDWILTLEVVEEQSAEVLLMDQICTTNFNGENTVYNLYKAVTGFENGYWINEDGLLVNAPGELDFLNQEEGSYLYTYVIENEAPCATTTYPLELIAKICSKEVMDTSVYVGNAFSPDGDNLNDQIFVQSNIADLPIKSFSIYDRWGERVFLAENLVANDPMVGWDGKFKNQIVSQGVYVYVINLGNRSGRKIVGDIMVMR